MRFLKVVGLVLQSIQSRSTVRQLAEGAGFRPQTVKGPWYFFHRHFCQTIAVIS